MELKRITAAACVALLCCAACSRPAAPNPDGGVSPRAPRAGIKVPLPDGWRAEIGQDQSFRAGPAGRTILRVDLRPGAAESFPTPAALERSFAAALPVTRVERQRVIDSKNFVGLRLQLAAPYEDGGQSSPQGVFMGVRRIGKDLFLCATAPGASDAELDQAENSCDELTWSDGR